jgi:DNA-binding XRE family transcriptional regulator
LIRINAITRATGKIAPEGWSVVNNEAQFGAGATPGFGAQATAPDDARPYSEREFLALLGDRVRCMRVLRDMSRRDLARSSRVSERYIAQIEAGKGNVSIVLLLRIAHAIRCGKDDAA